MRCGDEKRDATEPGSERPNRRTVGWLPAGSALGLALLAIPGLLGVGCGEFPADPEKSLERALERGSLRVGVTDAPPWIRRAGDRAEGVEARLIESFADQLGLGIEWHWGPTEEHMEALETYRLDLAAGGLTRSNPWTKRIGASRPYYVERVRIGGLPDDADPEGVRVAVPIASPLAHRLRDRGFRPWEVADLWAPEVRGPRAAPVWELRSHGLDPDSRFELGKREHVLAVPPGENRLLTRLERSFPESQRVEAWLEEESR